jgi:hypothetical protein
MKRHHLVMLMMVLAGSILFGCGGGDSQSNSADTGDGMGIMSVSLTDASAKRWKAVYVTIGDISVCTEPVESAGDTDAGQDGNDCAWKVVAAPEETYNLLELVNGVSETLGETELPAGTYHQLRLTLKTELNESDNATAGLNVLGDTHRYANYVIDTRDEIYPLTISESLQDGIRLSKTFRIEEQKYTELLLDFDAGRSIAMTTQGAACRLKPVIRVVDMKQTTRITGTVSMMNPASDELAVEPAVVSVQHMDEAAGVVVDAATTTDAAGGYQLLLEKNKEYSIVVFSDQYTPACDFIATVSEKDDFQNDISRNFILDAAEIRPLRVKIAGVTIGSELGVSIRQVVEGCGSGDQDVEVLRKTLVADETGDLSFEVKLPVGKTYTIVTSIGGKASSRRMTINPGEGYQETTLSLGE